MSIDFYYMPMSAPCRSVIMLAKELNIPLNLKKLDLMAGEHRKPEFIKINPQHCVPTMVDNSTGLTMWESRAILAYLVNKYAPGHKLYPADAVKRAEVDRLRYFDIGTLYKAIGEFIYPTLFKGQPRDAEKEKVLLEKIDLLETQLAGKKWVAGDDLTIADLTIYASMGMVDIGGVDVSGYKNIGAWRERFGKLPYNQEVNLEPLEQFKAWLAAKAAEAAK